MNKKTVMPALVLLIICLAVTALVACANVVTKDTISQNQAAKQQATMQELIPGAIFETVEQDFSAEKVLSAYTAKKDGQIVGYIFNTAGEGGYGGDIPVTTALDANGVVLGLQVTVADETPGLGQNAAKDTFRNQYVGKETDTYTVVKSSPIGAGEIEALTGATKTSEGVTNAVNLAKAAYRELTGGEGK